MNREQKTDRLIENDIQSIDEAWVHGDTEFLCAILSGDGWIPYNQLTDEQLDEAYMEMMDNE